MGDDYGYNPGDCFTADTEREPFAGDSVVYHVYGDPVDGSLAFHREGIDFVVDSGATVNVIKDPVNCTDSMFRSGGSVAVGDGKKLKVEREGKLLLGDIRSGGILSFDMKLVPEMVANLLSISLLCLEGCSVHFLPRLNESYIELKDGTKVPMSFRNGHFYVQLHPARMAQDRGENYAFLLPVDQAPSADVSSASGIVFAARGQRPRKFLIGQEVKVNVGFWKASDLTVNPPQGYFTGTVRRYVNPKSRGKRNLYEIYFKEDDTICNLTELELTTNLVLSDPGPASVASTVVQPVPPRLVSEESRVAAGSSPDTPVNSTEERPPRLVPRRGVQMNIHSEDLNWEGVPSSSAAVDARLCPRAGDSGAVTNDGGADADTWHRRLHMSRTTRALVEEVTGGTYKHNCAEFCESCVMCNLKRKWKKTIKQRSKVPFRVLHTDVGSMEEYSQGGYKHFIVFVDDSSDYWFVYYLKDGFTSEDIITCIKRVMIATRNKVKVLHSDCASYYTSRETDAYCVGVGIEQSFSIPEHSDDNSKASVRTFGCVVYYHLHEATVGLRPKAGKGFLLGMVKDNNYWAYLIGTIGSNGVIYTRVSCDVVFNEKVYYFKQLECTRGLDALQVNIVASDFDIVDDAVGGDISMLVSDEHHYGVDNADRYDLDLEAIACYLMHSEDGASSVYVEPSSQKELDSWPEPERSLYNHACWEEILQVQQSSVKLVPESEPRRHSSRALSSHVVLKRKKRDIGVPVPDRIYDSNGNPRDVTREERALLEKWRYKARWTIHGNQQPAYQVGDTFSPAASVVLIRLMIAVLCCYDIDVKSSNDWKCYTFDVSNAFCWAELDPNDPPVFMRAPSPKFGKAGYVYQLVRALYGLRSSPRRWSELLAKSLIDMGWSQSEFDPSLFFFWKDGKLHGMLAPFVDDAMSVCEPWLWELTIEQLNKSFPVKDLGAWPKVHLGLEFIWTAHGVYITQQGYIKEMLHKFGYDDPRFGTKNTPFKYKTFLEPATSETNPADVHRYQQEVGSLQFLVCMTRPDCSNALTQLTKHLLKQDKCHRDAVQRVFQYLKKTINYGMYCKYGSSFRLDNYTDSDWASDKTDRKSVTGFVSAVDGFPLHYYARGQRSVSLNTHEAELYSLSQGVRCISWIRCVLLELKVLVDPGSVRVFCDNQSAIDSVVGNAPRVLSKHIDIRLQHVADRVKSKEIILRYVESVNNWADCFTKSLTDLEHHRQLNRFLQVLPEQYCV